MPSRREGRHARPFSGGANRPRFLPPPPKLTGRTRRVHQVVIGVLLLVGAVQGTFWTLATFSWSPVDEIQHYAYVESMARGHGVPTIGVDLASNEALAELKAVPTGSYRSAPVQPVNTDAQWSSSRVPYQALQGPAYYAAMVPFYWMGRPLGATGSLYAIRLGTVALTLCVIPLTWLLTRRLFPDQPGTWLVAAGLMAVVNSIYPGTVTNDTVAMVAATLAVLLFIRALDRPDRWTEVLLAGLASGFMLLTKMTTVVVVPFLAIAFVAALVVTRPSVTATLRWVGLFVAGAAVVLTPWLTWNLATYHSLSGSAALEATLGQSLLGRVEPNLITIENHSIIVRGGIWLGPVLYDLDYQTFWERVAVIGIGLGLLAATIRRRWRDLAVVGWCAASLPLAFVAIEAVFMGPFNGNGAPVGRHLLAGVPPTVIAIAASASLLVGLRWGPVLGAWLIAASLWLQVTVADTFVAGAYLATSLADDASPVVYQDRADTVVGDQDALTIAAGCRVVAVGVGFASPAPPSLEIRSESERTTATGGEPIVWIPTYRLDQPIDGPISIALPPGSTLRAIGSGTSDEVGFASSGAAASAADPVAAAYCSSADPDERSFDLLYTTGHPDQITLDSLRTVPRLLAAVAVAGALALSAATLALTIQRRAPSPPAPPPDP